VPELPEVETIVREVRPHLAGCRIVSVHVDWPRVIAAPAEDAEGFCTGARGRRIVDVRRRGKYVLLALDDGSWILIHLRMSGRLVLSPIGRPEHLRVAFGLNARDACLPDETLYFYCQRKFGRVWLVDDPDEVVGGLGPEPLSDELDLAAFAARIRARRGMLKPLLLNQRFLAGLGNIYVDEALFLAGLHPRRTADTLSEAEIGRLYDAIRKVLRRAIDLRGTTFDGLFVRPEGERGRQQERLQVYGQAGLPCVQCGTSVERIVVSQRGTHYCPRCQPAP